MLLFTYDEKLHKKNEREIAKEEGRKEKLLEDAKIYSKMTGVTIEEAIKIFSENDEN